MAHFMSKRTPCPYAIWRMTYAETTCSRFTPSSSRPWELRIQEIGPSSRASLERMLAAIGTIQSQPLSYDLDEFVVATHRYGHELRMRRPRRHKKRFIGTSKVISMVCQSRSVLIPWSLYSGPLARRELSKESRVIGLSPKSFECLPVLERVPLPTPRHRPAFDSGI